MRPAQDRRPQQWRSRFIENQVRSRIEFYKTYGRLVGKDVEFHNVVKTQDSTYDCDVEQFLAALDVIVDNAVQYAEGPVRINLELSWFSGKWNSASAALAN